MKTQIRRLYPLTFVVLLAFFAVSLYGVSLAFMWARDLPSRIVIDEEALSAAFGSVVTESYHAVFRDGDSATQVQVLTEQFLPMITDNPDARDWVDQEFRDDLLRLASSSNAAVSSAASEVLAGIDRSSDQPPSRSTPGE
ncbi:hypothetical protein [Aporhodopirellula aestuarii]|uniref:Uncharacterized protein n=1 Tax=Aporhodopirellula aestuarii TaxID=2950107 RepID=A0ABT0U4Z8_9BACT|nr:hypothetical protein [Aporhodopirellula aestuarii]MCM2371635.1 hypothetical protein [Aporhodopirellula aestuarii]